MMHFSPHKFFTVIEWGKTGVRTMCNKVLHNCLKIAALECTEEWNHVYEDVT